MVRRCVILFGVLLATSSVVAGIVVQQRGAGQFLGTEGVVLQSDATDCGLAALANLSHAIGKAIELDELRLYISVGASGLTLRALRDIADGFGIRLTGVLSSLKDPSFSPPWIAHFEGRGGHYVVVERYEKQSLIVADPARGRIRYSASAFRRRWSGYAMVLDPPPVADIRTEGGVREDICGEACTLHSPRSF
jgi:ABC-type bacteriocin/lantibiotic exporter with double-glycine peptidase domain